MNKTLIVLGNGFDLDLGWKTSYSDFYNSEIKYFNSLNKLPYIKEMIKYEYWYNIEGHLRQSVLSLSLDKIEQLNDYWQVCRNRLYIYLTHPDNHSYIYNTNKNGCAFSLLSEIRNSSIVSFNYTNPFTESGFEDKNILYVHGKLEDGAYGIKIGIDSHVKDNCDFICEDKIRCMIKSNKNDNINKFHSMIKMAKDIIIFGHSLGITDSDYFKPLFKSIIENRIINKNIYIVTYDKTSLQSITDNMLSYDISYSDLVLSKVDIQTIFTSKGKDDFDFCNMINKVDL